MRTDLYQTEEEEVYTDILTSYSISPEVVDLPEIIQQAISYNKSHVSWERWLIFELAFLSGDGILAAIAFQEKNIGLAFTMLVFGTQKYLSYNNSSVAINGKLDDATQEAMRKWSLKTIEYNQKNITDPEEVKRQLLEFSQNSYLNHVTQKKDVESKEYSWMVLSVQRKIFPGDRAKHDGQYGKGTNVKFQEAKFQKQIQQGIEMQEAIKKSMEVGNKYNFPAIKFKNLNGIEGPENAVFTQNKIVTWAGDPFVVIVSIVPIMWKEEKLRDELDIRVFYNGNDISDRKFTSRSNIALPAGRTNYNPVIYTLPADIEKSQNSISNTLFVDIFRDGSYVIMLNDITSFNKKWNPPWRKHEMIADKIGKSSYSMNPLTVQPKNSVPASGGGISFKSEKISGKTTLSQYEALISAQVTLRDILDNFTTYGVRKQSGWMYSLLDNITAPNSKKQSTWDQIEEQLSQALIASSLYENSPVIASNATALKQMLINIKPKLQATSVSQYEESHPKSIGKEAAQLVRSVRSQYEKAALQSFSDLKAANQTLITADQAYARLPFQLTNLYLQQGSGIDEQISGLKEVGAQISMFRDMGGFGAKYMKVDQILGIRKDYSSGTTDMLSSYLHQYQDQNRNASPQLFERTMQLSTTASHMNGLFSLLAVYEMFRMYELKFGGFGKTVDFLWPGNAEETAESYITIFEGLLGSLESSYKKLGGVITESNFREWEAAESKILERYFRIVQRKKFREDLTFITGRLETIDTIKQVVKTLVVIALAAIASAIASPIAGAALAEAGLAGTVLSIGTFATEVFVFTLVERELSEKALGHKKGEFMDDLITNAATFGLLKGVSKIHKGIFKSFADPTVHKTLFTVSEVTTTLISLHGLAEAQYYLSNGKAMDWSERGAAIVQNLTLMGFIGLGSFVAKPFQTRMDAAVMKNIQKNFAKELQLLEGNRGAMAEKLKNIQNTSKPTPEQVRELGELIEKQFNSEVALIEMAMKKGLTPNLANREIVKYRQRIMELEIQLTQIGFEVQLGTKENFVPIEPGVIGYKDAKIIEQLKNYYESQPGGTFERLNNGVYVTKAGKESLTFVPAKAHHTVNKNANTTTATNGKIKGETVKNQTEVPEYLGFENNLESILSVYTLRNRKLTVEEFKILAKKSTDKMTPEEKEYINAIRDFIPLSATTQIQKVIPIKQAESYFIASPDGQGKTVGGYMTTVRDAAHLKTYQEVFDGMRLDYKGSEFVKSDATGYIVIEFFSEDIAFLEIPRNYDNGGTINDPNNPSPHNKNEAPFTGQGFTSGDYGILGVPELKAEYPNALRINDGGKMFFVNGEGSKVLIGIYNAKQKVFIQP